MVGDDTSKTAKLAMILHKILSEADEPPLLELTARTMGRLVKSGAALTSDIVDKEVRGTEGAEGSECLSVRGAVCQAGRSSPGQR